MRISRHNPDRYRRLFDLVECLIDDRIGIIREVVEYPRESGAPEFFHFYAHVCDTRSFCDQKNFTNTGGAAADRSVAMAKAIGEGLERYCSAIYERDEFPLISFKNAQFPCVAPSTFALYRSEQYEAKTVPFVPFEETTLVRWMPAEDLMTEETIYVPAAMVCLPYMYDKKNGEEVITQRVSTGLACHCSLAEATTSALCEVIERDAFTITWQARLSMPRIRPGSLSPTNRDLLDRFERTIGPVTVLNITLDTGVPTILSVLRANFPDSPALVFAAAADLDAEQAVRKSLEEIAHTRRLAQQLRSNRPPLIAGADFANVVKQNDHVHLYCDPANMPLASFIWNTDQEINFDEIQNLATGYPEEDLDILTAKIAGLGYRGLAVDLTTSDVDDLGLKVVRAIIPGFHPLFFGHRLRAMGGTRLWIVPQRLGYKGIAREYGDNAAPHPYP